MKRRILTTAIALIFGLSVPRGVAAKGHGGGHGGGHSGGGHSSGGHSGGGHSSGGHSGGGHSGGGHSGGGHSGGGHAAGGHASSGPASGGHAGSGRAGGGHSSGGRPPAVPPGGTPTGTVAPSPARGALRPPDGHPVVGTAVPRSSRPRDVFVFTPSIYASRYGRPHFTGLGFGFSIRHPGYGFGPAYYGLGYDHPLLCEIAIDCDLVPVTGVVDVPQYEAAPPEVGSGSVRLEVQPTFAQIFVDGEYVGTVGDVQSATGLVIAAGVHRVEFRAPGYEPLVVDIHIAAGRRITYRGALSQASS